MYISQSLHDLAPTAAVFIRERLPANRVRPAASLVPRNELTAERRMAELIDALLRLSRLAHADIGRSEIDMRELISQNLVDLRSREPHRKVEATVEQLPAIHGDSVLMRQVFENLLTDAFKYTRRRPVARIHVGFSATQEEIAFFVRDNGAGFDMRRAGRLFSPFERLHAAHEFEGIGVGLALVRRIVERHGGRVWAEATCRIGATLHVAIPHRGYDIVTLPSRGGA